MSRQHVTIALNKKDLATISAGLRLWIAHMHDAHPELLSEIDDIHLDAIAERCDDYDYAFLTYHNV